MGPVLNQTVPAYANIYLQYAFHVFAIVITFAHNSSQACTFASVIGNIEEGTSLETSDNSEVHRWISLSHTLSHTHRKSPLDSCWPRCQNSSLSASFYNWGLITIRDIMLEECCFNFSLCVSYLIFKWQ